MQPQNPEIGNTEWLLYRAEIECLRWLWAMLCHGPGEKMVTLVAIIPVRTVDRVLVKEQPARSRTGVCW